LHDGDTIFLCRSPVRIAATPESSKGFSQQTNAQQTQHIHNYTSTGVYALLRIGFYCTWWKVSVASARRDDGTGPMTPRLLLKGLFLDGGWILIVR
jgi:hypothetical protein